MTPLRLPPVSALTWQRVLLLLLVILLAAYVAVLIVQPSAVGRGGR